jgi:hypothetical protein
MTALGRELGSRCQEKPSHLAASLPRQRVPDLPILGDYSAFPWLRRCAPSPQARARFAQRQLTPPLMVLPTLPRVPWSRPIFTATRHFDRRNGDLGLGLSGNLQREGGSAQRHETNHFRDAIWWLFDQYLTGIYRACRLMLLVRAVAIIMSVGLVFESHAHDRRYPHSIPDRIRRPSRGRATPATGL